MKSAFNITGYFLRASAEFPARPAIIESGRIITFSQLQNEVEAAANYFLSQGITKGDRVLVFVPMGIDLYRSVLALFRIGAVPVFLDAWVGLKRLNECCTLAQCKGFVGVTLGRLLRILIPGLRRIPVFLSLRGRSAQAGIRPETFPEDPALITFTTGSTGTPKAAIRTHGQLNSQFTQLRDKIQPGRQDVDLTLLPIVLLINLGIGCSSVITKYKGKKPGSFRAIEILRQVHQYGVNRITGSPFFVEQLANYLVSKKSDASTVKQVFTGGAPVFPHQAKRIMAGFQDAEITIVYGSTEAEPVSSITGRDLLARYKTGQGLPAGKPGSGSSVLIIPVAERPLGPFEHAEELKACPPGEPGEIIIAGAQVVENYLNNTAAFLQNKIVIGGTVFHRTGDCGYLDAEGQLYLMGRCSAIIQHNNGLVYPFVAEAVLQSVPGVGLATIIKVNGKLNVVFEAFSPGVLPDLKKSVLHLLPPVQHFIQLNKLPRDKRHHSKIDYNQLRELVVAHLAE